MESRSVNLTRKWRSAQFQEIVGQELVVRILQNSLFKNQFFPAYLMSGQRGCGKTSTARVFAAAVNCAQLSEFHKNPKITVPCLTCVSCVAMKSGQHPDFIEIDAASYTGVDNIRHIIDTSSFMPILGTHKIYLIDEVHMLSKAAFNALLKILEEPSRSVIFILATTEAQKLPDTIRSRCFQLLFNPVGIDKIVAHLQVICSKDEIGYDLAGLEMIAQSTQGSLRDAINLLEQARFASSQVTKPVVTAVLGYVDDAILCQLLVALVQQNQEQLLKVLPHFSERSVSMEYVIKRLLELLYDAIVIQYGGQAKYALDVPQEFTSALQTATIATMMHWFDQMCQLDAALSKTSKKLLLFEAMLLRLSATSQGNHLVDDQKKK